ncbi:hypothetical protein AB833_28445 [Chromatiales bacterium (ex Bugula neritina AB1)]|nr:hypothetical protein AB833_28445 [Chromatiales bacterium (ex Bugula neritina AB1)]
MNTPSVQTLNLTDLDSLDDAQLSGLRWKELQCFNGRLLELHAEGLLDNEFSAKLPRKPILCIDKIEVLNEERIEASFTFPANASDWPYAIDEALEMLFQDQLDQLVGFWAARKINGIGRALSSGACTLHQSLNFEPAKQVLFVLEKRKWMENSSTGTGTAVFNAKIQDTSGQLLLETRNVIVGILNPQDIQELRKQYGGQQGVKEPSSTDKPSNLRVPVFDNDPGSITGSDGVYNREATQVINPDLWPLRYHFRGDPVVPGNFGTHGMIALLKDSARDDFGLKNPVFKSLSRKSFSGMIFEDPKQIRFKLINISQNDAGDVVAEEAGLYLEDSQGNALIEAPIYTFKNLTVTESV